MVYAAISNSYIAPSAVMAAGAINLTSQRIHGGPQAQTWPGKCSKSMAGYIARRFLAGINPFQQAKGVSLYNLDRRRLKERFRYQQLPCSEQEEQLCASHAAFHSHRLDWAAKLVEKRWALQSPEGREAYDQATKNLFQINMGKRALWREMIEDWEHGPMYADLRQRNIYIGGTGWDRWKREKPVLVKAEEVELDWQIQGYRDLIKVAQDATVKPSRGQIKRLREAVKKYESSMREYIEYDRRMSQDDPKAREHRRKKAEHKAGVDSLRELNRTFQEIFRKIGHRGVEALSAPLTFHTKTQAKLIDQGPNGMSALEPLAEIDWNLKDVVKRAKQGSLPVEELDMIAATLFGCNLLSWQYGSFRVLFPEGFPLFSHHRPFESGLIDGLSTFVQGESTVGKGAVSHWTHTGAMDYAAVVSAAYLLGLNPPAVLAEEAFKYIVTLAGFLKLRGAFLKRPPKGASQEVKDRIMKEVYDAMAARVLEGLMVAIFGTGTRAIEYPLVSPYSDLAHPGALHLPGEFPPSRDMTGMPVKLAMMANAGIYIFAANLYRGGVPVPDIPRTPRGFFSSNNNFHRARIGEEDGFVALAGYLPPESLIQLEDIHPGASVLPDDSEEKKEMQWNILQMNSAIVREMEKMAGRRADTGLVYT